MANHLIACVLGIALAGCTSSHVRSDAMTAYEHERAAADHLAAAHEELGQYDPEERGSFPCLALGPHGGQDCMAKPNNKTLPHLHAAELEQTRAAEHAAAAAALRDAETRTCRGFSETEREDGPLTGGRLAFSAQPLIDYDDQATVFGVVMAFGEHAVDVDRLQAAVECHRARLASRGRPFQPHECPLDDASLAAFIIAAPRGALLQLRSEDPAAARRAWESARKAATASQRARTTPSRPGAGGS